MQHGDFTHIEIPADDPGRATHFYGELFGWTFDDVASHGADGSYLVARLDGRRAAAIGTTRAGISSDASWNTYVATNDADATAALVGEAGGTVVAGPMELFDIGRVAMCTDPARAAFGLWQPRAIGGADVVNAPGSWNFSELNTADADEATPFYGRVFGWEADEVDMGGAPATMVRLPGYADFLEQFDPGIRQRHADFGAPPGFSDCVAWIQPLGEGGTPHWSVTFAVADSDAIAARARELGGTVEAEPFDAGPVRSAVIRDPLGARFAASAFNPD